MKRTPFILAQSAATFAAMVLVALTALGCEEGTETRTSSPAASTAPAPSGASSTAAPSASAATAPSEDAAAGTLGAHLNDVHSVLVQRFELTGADGMKRYEIALTDSKEVAAMVATLDLKAELGGPIARCPDDYALVFRDAEGKSLGRLGICGAVPGKTSNPDALSARFTPAGKAAIGATLKDPKALSQLLQRHGKDAKPAQ
jgi:hypothetical protein